jgi:DNA uptake protein ComE-like DNA-binding protein
MANRSRDRGDRTSAWVPQGAESRSTNGTEDHGVAETTSQWLLDERKSPPARQTTKAHLQAQPQNGHPPEEALAEQRSLIAARENRLEGTLQEREAEFAQGLREIVEVFKQRRAELGEELAALRERLEIREAELREHGGREEALRGRIRELESALAEAKRETNSKRTRTGKVKKGRLDVNSATFEQFRDLGLPVTQCARIISYRDVRHGFGSLEELDGIPGLPRETQTTLKSQLGI